MKPVHAIAAVCENNGIGFKNALPWKLKKEMQYFTTQTTKTESKDLQNAVIMGRRTWDSVPPKYKPFSKRLNVVISRSQLQDLAEGVLHYTSIEDAVKALQGHPTVETIWIIGGKDAYQEAINKGLCDKLYITKVKKEFECDTFFPKFDENDYELINEPSCTNQSRFCGIRIMPITKVRPVNMMRTNGLEMSWEPCLISCKQKYQIYVLNSIAKTRKVDLAQQEPELLINTVQDGFCSTTSFF
jgi:dihydrofolate reductase